MDADEANAFWSAIRHQSHHHFNPTQSLWRISLPATTPPLHGLDGQALIEWGGALRWLTGTHHATALRQQASALGGHVTLMRAVNNDAPRFHPLSGKLAELNRNLKVAFDPADILNRGRMGQF
jgi:glycolate oxidase FAD binding subunit